MPLNERYFSSKFHGYDFQKCKRLRENLATTPVEAAAARPPFSAFVSCVAIACVRMNSLRCA